MALKVPPARDPECPIRVSVHFGLAFIILPHNTPALNDIYTMLQKTNTMMESNHATQKEVTKTYGDMQRKLITSLDRM